MTKEQKDYWEWQAIRYCAMSNKSVEETVWIMEQTKRDIEKQESEDRAKDILEQSFL